MSDDRSMEPNTTSIETPRTPPASRRALVRPVAGRMFGGVAAGLANYLGISVGLMRFAFVVAAILGGTGVALYIAGWLLRVPNSEELIELCSFPPSGPVKVQEDLVHLAFQVENLDQTIAALQQRGVRITDGPTTTSSGSRFLFIDAPDGYEVELIERPAGVKIV